MPNGLPPLSGDKREVQRFLVVLRAAAIVAIVAGFCVSGPVAAQLSLPSSVPNPVSATGIRQEGLFFTAPIHVDANQVFKIAGPLNPNSAHLPLAQRQLYVQTAIAEVLATHGSWIGSTSEYDPRSLRVEVVQGGDVASLQVTDDRHREPLAIVTVNSDDARYYQSSIPAVAEQWQTALQAALTMALELRQPQRRAANLREVGRVAAVLALSTLLLSALLVVLGRRIQRLRAAVAAQTDKVAAQRSLLAEKQEGSTHHQRSIFLSLALTALAPSQQLQYLRASSAVIYALINLMWFVAVTWAFTLFPRTSSRAQTLTNDALAIAVTVVVTVFLDRVLDLAINRIATFWTDGSFAETEDLARQVLRVPTISHAIRAIKSAVLIFIAGLTILTQLGVPIGSVVTIGGIAALALSFAAQSFVRDFVNGFLVLIEDQYVVGDYISIVPYSGIVENFSLRMVQIRDSGGDLVTIPHGSVTMVVNRSRNWSRIDFRVPVAPEADIPKALALVQSSIEDLAREPEWHDAIRLPLEFIGVDQISKDWVIIRAAVKTGPLRQFEGRREINLRVQQAFAKAGIALGAQFPANYYS
jgi:small conductance mechanosensitive channel